MDTTNTTATRFYPVVGLAAAVVGTAAAIVTLPFAALGAAVAQAPYHYPPAPQNYNRQQNYYPPQNYLPLPRQRRTGVYRTARLLPCPRAVVCAPPPPASYSYAHLAPALVSTATSTAIAARHRDTRRTADTTRRTLRSNGGYYPPPYGAPNGDYAPPSQH
jgi:hypothetical protein